METFNRIGESTVNRESCSSHLSLLSTVVDEIIPSRLHHPSRRVLLTLISHSQIYSSRNLIIEGDLNLVVPEQGLVGGPRHILLSLVEVYERGVNCVSLAERGSRKEGEVTLTRVLDTRREVSTVLVLDVFEMGFVFIGHRLGVEETDKNWNEREKRIIISILFLEMRWTEFFSSSIYRILRPFCCLVVEHSVCLLLPDLSSLPTPFPSES